jgi:hypothetical protein
VYGWRDEALEPLAHRQRAAFRCFNWSGGGGLGDAVFIEARPIVVVEGVYAARPEFDDVVDLKVLVEVAPCDRKRRRDERPRTVSRSDPQGWDACWEAAEQVYFDMIRPPSSFDLVVSGAS